MLWSVILPIIKTSSVTPDFFYVFNLILSFSTCSQSFKKYVRGNFRSRTSLSLGSHVGNHSRPTPPTVISLLLLFFRLVGWAVELGPDSYPDFLSFFSLRGFSAGFLWPPSNHDVLLVVAQLLLFF